jgi:hypothetical protein
MSTSTIDQPVVKPIKVTLASVRSLLDAPFASAAGPASAHSSPADLIFASAAYHVHACSESELAL